MAKTQQKETLTEDEKKKQIYDMVDNLVKKSHVALDQMAVEETKRGVVEDKTTKNMYASENIWNSLRHEKTVGVY